MPRKIKSKYSRILLKLTGELFGDSRLKGLDFNSVNKVTNYIHNIYTKYDIQLAIVVGSGNLFRGRNVKGTNVDRATADYIGMLATIMNALALQESLERHKLPTRVMSAVAIQSLCEPFIRRKALSHLENGKIVILAAGTGNPFFTTDSAAALKACELKCDILLKGTSVEGIYNKDPKKNKNAVMYKTLSYQEALVKNLTVMDNTAFALSQREKVPIIVFNINHLDNIEKIIRGEHVGTLIKR